MRLVVVLVLLILASSLQALSMSVPSLQQLNRMPEPERLALMKNMFEEFKVTHNRKYSAADEPVRFDVFQENMKQAAYLNSVNPYAQFGATQFADLTDDDFRKTVLTNVTGEEDSNQNETLAFTNNLAISSAELGDAPESWDWAKMGYVWAVRDQGRCGSCWAWSAAETIEMVLAIASNNTQRVDLSVQQLVDCAPYPTLGCNGGFPRIAFVYALKIGLVPAQSYPYSAVTGRCRAVSVDPSVPHPGRIRWWRPVADDAPSIRAVIAKYGPVTATVDATRWKLYQSGTVTSSCWTGQRNHAVQIVGYDTDAKGAKFWKVRNTWTDEWGMGGYIQIGRIGSVCGILNGVTAIGI